MPMTAMEVLFMRATRCAIGTLANWSIRGGDLPKKLNFAEGSARAFRHGAQRVLRDVHG